ncbi:NUDIX hydrolase [soil metagenome]
MERKGRLAMPDTPKIMVDVVIPQDGGVILIRRGSDPYKGMWALPGGFVEVGETVENAAVRETKEETNLDVALENLVGVYSEPKRDPRGHNVSVTFLARVTGGTAEAATDADEVGVLNPSDVELAFDHRSIIEDAFN